MDRCVPLRFVLETGVFSSRGLQSFPRRNSRYWFKDSLGIATRGDPGGIYAPIQPLEGRPGQGRSRETSHGAALEKLC